MSPTRKTTTRTAVGLTMILLDHCTIEWVLAGARVVFMDGTETTAFPHPEQVHYFIVSHRCGYGDDVMAYCREHELAHAFLAQELRHQASHVLESQAHGWMLRRGTAVLEEMAVQMFQRWARGNERPIVGQCDWDDLKARFIAHSDKEGLAYVTRTRVPAQPAADSKTPDA